MEVGAGACLRASWPVVVSVGAREERRVWSRKDLAEADARLSDELSFYLSFKEVPIIYGSEQHTRWSKRNESNYTGIDIYQGYDAAAAILSKTNVGEE